MVCPTRWTVRHTCINSILKNYKVLKTALEQIQEGRDEYAAKASGLLAHMEKFETYFALKLAHLVFSSSEQLSINLQSVDITIQEALNGAELLSSHLQSLRNDKHFDRFYDLIYQDSRNLTDEPCLPRQRKTPRRYDAHQYEDPKARYRHAYFEVLDLAGGEVERRFNHEDLHTIKQIEVLLLAAGNGEQVDTFSPLIQNYLKDDFDLERLKTHLSLVKNMIKEANSQRIPVTRVTNVRTISEAMNTSHIYKTMLSEVAKLLKLYFTFPVTTATSERSFSSIRTIKTFLRSTMMERRLNNLFVLYVHKSITDTLDFWIQGIKSCLLHHHRNHHHLQNCHCLQRLNKNETIMNSCILALILPCNDNIF